MKRSALKRKSRLQAKSSLKNTSTLQRNKPMSKHRSKRARAKEFTPATRQVVAERSGGVCEMCHAEPAVHLHHCIYRSQGGTRDISNCLHLGLRCHELCHSNREARELAVRLAAELASGQATESYVQ